MFDNSHVITMSHFYFYRYSVTAVLGSTIVTVFKWTQNCFRRQRKKNGSAFCAKTCTRSIQSLQFGDFVCYSVNFEEWTHLCPP